MSWSRFFLWSAVWVMLGPILAIALGAPPIDGLIGSAITYVFPLGGVWVCAAMSGLLD